MKNSDVRKLDMDGLKAKLADLKDEEFNFKMQITTQQLPNYRKYYQTKRDIARVKTFITELEGKRAVTSKKGK